jgi:hypothetical protein
MILGRRSSIVSGITAYWKFDEGSGTTVNDFTSNGNTGTLGGTIPIWVKGKIVNGLQFTGSNSYVSVAQSSAFDFGTNDFTIAMWIYPQNITTATTDYQTIWDGGYTANKGVLIEINRALTRFLVYCNAATRTFTATWQNNTWYHIVVTRNSGLMTSYINGVSIGSIAETTNILPSSVRIGAWTNGENFQGIIDEIGVWKRGFSLSDVTQLYAVGNGMQYPFSRIISNGGNSLKQNLVSYHKLDGNARDSVGASNGTDTGVNYITGKITSCASFSGATFINNIGDTTTYSFIQNTGIFSFSLWVNLNNTNTQYPMGNSPTTIEKGFYCGFVGGKFEYAVTNGTSSAFVYKSGGMGNFIPGNWYHIALAANGTSATTYINGVSVNTTGLTASLSTGNSTRDLYFGQIGGFALQRFDGRLDEVGFWNKALTQNEVSSLYSYGVGNQYPFSKIISNVYEGLKRNLFVYYKLDGNSNDSNRVYNGTDTNITYTTGKILQSASFNGSSSKIALTSDAFNFTDDFSISAWINTNSIPTGGNVAGIFGNYIFPPLSDGSGYYLAIFSNRFYFLTETVPSSPIKVFSTTFPNINQWYHVVATRNTTTGLALYINGF